MPSTIVELPDKTEVEFPEGMDELAIHRELVKAFPNLGQQLPSERTIVPTPPEASQQLGVRPEPLAPARLAQLPEPVEQIQEAAATPQEQALQKKLTTPLVNLPVELYTPPLITLIAPDIGRAAGEKAKATLESMTSPEGLATMAYVPVGGAEGIAIKEGAYVARVLAAAFGVQGAAQLPDAAKRYVEAVSLKDRRGATEAWMDLVNSSAMALGGVEGVSGLKQALSTPPIIDRPPAIPKSIMEPSRTVILPETQAELDKLPGGQDASSIEAPATVHGDVRPQPEPSQGQVPVKEGGAGVLAQREVVPPQQREPQPQSPAETGGTVRDVTAPLELPPKEVTQTSETQTQEKGAQEGVLETTPTTPEALPPTPAAEQEVKPPAAQEQATPAGKVEPAGAPTSAEPMRQGPGAKTYTESAKPEAPESFEGTGLKNAIGDLERVSYGFAERTPAEKQAMAEAWIRAGETAQRSPEAARRLAAQLEANPKRGLTGDESALLLRHKVTLENALNDAAERTITETDPALKAEAQSDINRLRDELERFLDTIAKRGTEWGREGRWRQALAYEDFSFQAQERLLRASKGGAELTDAEREGLIRTVEEHKAKVAELEAHLKEQETRAANADAARMLAETRALAAQQALPAPHIMRLVQKIRQDIKRGADESRKFIAGAQFSLSPEVLYHLTRIGADNFLEIGENFVKWSGKMVQEIGDRVKPYLEQLWETSKKMALEDSVKAEKQDKAKVRNELVKPDKAERQQKVLTALKEATAEGLSPGELGRYVKEIVKQVVESGVTEHEAVFDATKKILDDAGVVLDKDTIKQAFSDYGKSIAAPTDPVAVRLAQLRGEAQKLLGLKDVVEKSQPPKATGPRRPKVSDLYRRTLAKINEELKRRGIVATDPERQLADALQARKTYRENRIKDLRYELATGQRIVKGKSVPIEDAELKALDAEYRALKAEHGERFPKEAPTQEQQIAAASRGLDREIATVEEQIRTGNVLPEAPRTRLSTPELEAKRAKLDALRDQRQELRELNEEFQRLRAEDDLKRQKQSLLDQIEAKQKQLASGAQPGEAKQVNRPLPPELEPLKQRVEELNKQLAEVRNPKRTREEMALSAMKRRATTRIADIQDRIARSDFSKKPTPTPVKPDAEAMRLMGQVKQLEQKLAEARIKNERANRSWGEWAQDTFVDWSRGTKLLSPYVFPKLVVAGITRLTTNPIYRLAGQPLRVIPGLASKAPNELRMSIRAEASAVAAILKSPPQMWNKLFKGKSNLDVLEGRLAKSREMSGLIGNAHGMVKEPVRQAAFARSIELNTQEAVRIGLNPREPAVAATIESSALADARREIFMNENMITKALVRIPVEYLRHSGKTGAKTIANVIEFLQPIVNVPANITIASARLNPVIGFSEALLRLAKAAKDGELRNRAAELSKEDAESIARAFKYGAVGTFLAAFAWKNPDMFGGVYGEQGKKRDLKPGQMKFMGVKTPSWLGHAPEMAFLNEVAAARRVYDRYYKTDGPYSAASEALAFSLMAPVKNLPFIDTYLRLFSTYQSPVQVMGAMVRDATLPTGQILKVLDDQERQPKTFWQEIEMGIPGLRSEVPTKAQVQQQQELQRRATPRQRRPPSNVPLVPP